MRVVWVVVVVVVVALMLSEEMAHGDRASRHVKAINCHGGRRWVVRRSQSEPREHPTWGYHGLPKW